MPSKNSQLIKKYFNQRNSYPATLLFKNTQVKSNFLVDLDETIQDEFTKRDDIVLRKSFIITGEFWSGILLEFNNNEFSTVNSKKQSITTETLLTKLESIYRYFDENGTVVQGVSIGDTVYDVDALKSLDKSQFKTSSDVYSGPSIE